MAGLYIHIPFCKQRCIYCDFYSTTYGISIREKYLVAIGNEMILRHSEIPDEPLQTIYIGGGTPSLLTIEELTNLFRTIRLHFAITENAEVTMEANPDDLSESYVEELKKLPINRLSIGIQSFNDIQLRFLRRRHDSYQAKEAVRRCRQAGFENISIDLIYGLPNQSLKDWKEDLHQALGLGIQHLSAYALIYEEDTLLWKMRKQQTIKEASEELSLQMFEYLIDTAREAGLLHYEISNFALPGHISRHNSSYWKGIPYLGIGPGAHSYDGKNRQWNHSHLEYYLKADGDVNKKIMGYSLSEKEFLTEDERYNDYILVSLRTSEGLDIALLKQLFGEERCRYALRMAAPYLKEKMLEQVAPTFDSPEGFLRLTRKGIFISDRLMSDLLIVS